jgi:hypothetical protein
VPGGYSRPVRPLGGAYHHIPVEFQAPTIEDLTQFCMVMQAAGKRVFVRGAANSRMVSFVSLYGQATLDWSSAHATTHVRRFWEPNEVWAAIIERARRALGMCRSPQA